MKNEEVEKWNLKNSSVPRLLRTLPDDNTVAAQHRQQSS